MRTNYSQYRRYFFDIVALYKRRQDLRAFLEILLSLGTIILFVIFAVKPTVITISQLLTELKNKEDTISQMDKKIQDLQIAQSLLSQNSSGLALLALAIPDSPTPEAELRQIEGVAKKDNVQILGLSTGEVALVGTSVAVKTDPTLQKLPLDSTNIFTVSGTFNGDFASLSTFLKDIENLRRPVFIDTLTFSSVTSQGGQKILLSLTGRVPFVKH